MYISFTSIWYCDSGLPQKILERKFTLKIAKSTIEALKIVSEIVLDCGPISDSNEYKILSKEYKFKII